MKIYQVYSRGGEFQFVKDGWSWPAFFFGFWWMLIKKMWGPVKFWCLFLLVWWILGGILFVVFPDYIGMTMVLGKIVGFIVNCWLGVYGNEIRGRWLERCGWVSMGWMGAKGIADAEKRVYTAFNT